jgi:hypothetical protein
MPTQQSTLFGGRAWRLTRPETVATCSHSTVDAQIPRPFMAIIDGVGHAVCPPTDNGSSISNGDKLTYCEAHAYWRRKTIRLPLLRRMRPDEQHPPISGPQPPLVETSGSGIEQLPT